MSSADKIIQERCPQQIDYRMGILEACHRNDLESLECALLTEDVNTQDPDGMTGLMVACQRGHSSVVSRLVELGASVHIQDHKGRTALHIASDLGHIACCHILTEHGSLLDSQDKEGSTPLCRASFNGHVNCCSLLLEKGASCDMQAKNGLTPLHVASDGGHVACCRVLIENGAPIDNKDSEGLTPLYKASLNGHFKCCSLLLEKGASCDIQTKNGLTPLHAASYGGHNACCLVLIESRANIDYQDNSSLTAHNRNSMNGLLTCSSILQGDVASYDILARHGQTPLHVASASGHVVCCRTLIQNKASVEKPDRDGRTALHLSSSIDCTSLLLETRAANVNKSDNDGFSPLHNAAAKGDVAICRKLLAHGASIDAINVYGESPLLLASASGSADCCRVLLEKGASVNSVSKEGLTPLSAAYMGGHETSLRHLLGRKEAFINCRGSTRETPLCIACRNGHIGCAQALLERGANPSPDQGESPIDIARSKGYLDIVKMLERSGDRNPKRGKGKNFIHRVSKYLPEMKTEAKFYLAERKTEECENIRKCRQFKNSLHLPDNFFDSKLDVCFCESCLSKRGHKRYYDRGQPPKPYALPVGWVKFGLHVQPGKATSQKVFEIWHVAFHGTRVDCVKNILETGELLMPGDYTPEGDRLRLLINHYNEDNPAMKPPQNHDVSKIYLSPSIRYSGLEVYAPKHGYIEPTTEIIRHARVALQVRIMPGSYDVGDQTIGATSQIDPMLPNSELEWTTKRRGVTVFVGLLVNVQP